jgi:5'-methylthioadenosine phosphorylase
MVKDFDCWHPDYDAVTVQDLIKVFMANAEKAPRLVARLTRDFPLEIVRLTTVSTWLDRSFL